MRIRTSDPAGRGWRRLPHGRGFRYLDTEGRPLGPADRERVRALVIPPAWRDVLICPWPNGHIQAVGADDAGRRQYLYRSEYRARQERAKHTHVLEVAAALPVLREAVRHDLGLRGLCQKRVLACAARLLAVLELYADGVTVAPELGRLGEHGGFGRPATHGAPSSERCSTSSTTTDGEEVLRG